MKLITGERPLDPDEWKALQAAKVLAEKGKLRARDVIHQENDWVYGVGGYLINERLLPHDARPWRPFVKTVLRSPTGVPDPDVLAGREESYANGHYLVFIRKIEAEDGSHHILHLSLRTVENDARHDWREFQRIKNELAGPEWEALELYPAVDRVVDTANQYHLWCFPYRLPFGFNNTFVMDHGAVETTGGSQRPLSEHDHAATHSEIPAGKDTP